MYDWCNKFSEGRERDADQTVTCSQKLPHVRTWRRVEENEGIEVNTDSAQVLGV
jgi:hypothetical protein